MARSSGSYLWDSGTLLVEKRIQRLQDLLSLQYSVHGIFFLFYHRLTFVLLHSVTQVTLVCSKYELVPW